MYHEVLPDDTSPEGSGYFAVRASRFAEQLDALTARGARASTVESVIDDSSARRVAVTFDDGHWTHAAVALPLLVARNMSATFFVITARVGTPGYCTWDDLRQMSSAGMSVQSHTHTHPFLSQLDRGAVDSELRRSREELDDQLAQRTTTLALPGGDAPHGWRAHDYLRAGYKWVATSKWGPNATLDHGMFIRRYTIRRETSMDAFTRLAQGSVSSYSPEGLRLVALNRLRSLLGAGRYARWRRRLLATMGR